MAQQDGVVGLIYCEPAIPNSMEGAICVQYKVHPIAGQFQYIAYQNARESQFSGIRVVYPPKSTHREILYAVTSILLSPALRNRSADVDFVDDDLREVLVWKMLQGVQWSRSYIMTQIEYCSDEKEFVDKGKAALEKFMDDHAKFASRVNKTMGSFSLVGSPDSTNFGPILSEGISSVAVTTEINSMRERDQHGYVCACFLSNLVP
jgi:hypothetical protein